MIKRRTYLCICEGQQETMYLAQTCGASTGSAEKRISRK